MIFALYLLLKVCFLECVVLKILKYDVLINYFMKKNFRNVMLCAFLACQIPSFAQIKVEAESYTDAKSLSSDIILENNGQTIGYFDEAGEILTYEVDVPEDGLYQFSFKYLAGKTGSLKIDVEGASFVFETTANLGVEKWWELPRDQWPSYKFEDGALYELKAGKNVFKAVNVGTGLNIDYFEVKKSSETDGKVASISTSPEEIRLMPNESMEVIPTAYNAAGKPVASSVVWSENAKDGIYKSGSDEGSDAVLVKMGEVSKVVPVVVAKPKKKQNFVVTKHGKLNTKNGAVCDQNGKKVSLMGPSYFWSCSRPMWWCKENVDFLVSKYNIQLIRLPVSIAPGDNTWDNPSATWNEDNFLHRPDYTKALVDEMVKAAIENDIYVIIDFHEHYAQHWVELSKEFFTYFAEKWGDYPNVMYEIYNEPMTDDGTVVNYAKQIIPVIRKIDDDNIIIVGSSDYSRHPDAVTSAGDGYSNIAYTWHGYVKWGHQNDWNGRDSWNNGVPVIVTEWGVEKSRNDGGLLSIYRQKGLINAFWSMCNKGGEDANWSVLKSDCYKVADWSDDEMNDNGKWLLETARSWVDYKPEFITATDFSLAEADGQKKVFAEGEKGKLDVKVSGASNCSFRWVQVSGPSEAKISSDNSQSADVEFGDGGEYEFCVVVFDGTNTKTFFLTLTYEAEQSSVAAEKAEAGLRVYPNPSADGCFNIVAGDACDVVVYDLKGVALQQFKIEPDVPKSISVDAKGVYVLKAGSEFKKLVVE